MAKWLLMAVLLAAFPLDAEEEAPQEEPDSKSEVAEADRPRRPIGYDQSNRLHGGMGIHYDEPGRHHGGMGFHYTIPSRHHGGMGIHHEGNTYNPLHSSPQVIVVPQPRRFTHSFPIEAEEESEYAEEQDQ
jgi:hypothetical protein